MTDTRMKALSLLPACLLLGACAGAPHPLDSGIAAPPAWQYGAGDTRRGELQRWWTRFGAGELDGLVQRALDNSQDLAAAIARVDQARASAVIAGAPLLPEVNAQLGATREKLLHGAGYSGIDASEDDAPVIGTGASDETCSLQPVDQGRDRAGRELQPGGQVMHRRHAVLPERQHDEVLRVGQPELAQ